MTRSARSLPIPDRYGESRIDAIRRANYPNNLLTHSVALCQSCLETKTGQPMNHFTLVSIACLSLAGCGTFKLASGGTPPVGKTVDQQTMDVLVCKDEARTRSQAADKQARGFALGFFLPVVGIAVDYQAQKADQRASFKSCMERRGYSITTATD